MGRNALSERRLKYSWGGKTFLGNTRTSPLRVIQKSRRKDFLKGEVSSKKGSNIQKAHPNPKEPAVKKGAQVLSSPVGKAG